MATNGYIFQNYEGQYEIINEIGNVVEKYNDLESAQKRYDELDLNGGMIDWDTLYVFREENGQNKKEEVIHLTIQIHTLD